MSYCVRQWGNPLGLRSNDRNSALVNDAPRDLPGGIVLYWSVGVFVGQYDHSIDSKGRVVLPAPFRAFVAERGYVTQLDGCIGLWNAEHFTQVAQKWKTESEAGRISMRVFRKLMSSVSEIKLDSAGRINLPQELTDELSFNKNVVLCGLYDRVEIWPAETFESDNNDNSASEELADAVARLGL